MSDYPFPYHLPFNTGPHTGAQAGNQPGHQAGHQTGGATGVGAQPAGYGSGAPSNPAWNAGSSMGPNAGWPQGMGMRPDQNPSSGFGFTHDRFIKGALIGAAAAYLLTNENVQRTIIKSAVRTWSFVQSSVEEVKERFHDAQAEVETESAKAS